MQKDYACMQRDCVNIYLIARLCADKDRQTASIELNVSYRTLQGYEIGERIPASQFVKSMAKVYGASWLGYYHLALNDDIGRDLLERPSLEDIFIHEKSAS